MKVKNQIAFISLGTNMGDRLLNLEQAKTAIEQIDIEVISGSSIYETEAWGNKSQAAFYNQVCQIKTFLDPSSLLKSLLAIEKSLGRERKQKWEARIIDIDVLFFNNEIINEVGLAIPHPHLHERRFVLIPLVEIAPNIIHPVLKKTSAELLNQLTDNSRVTALNIPSWKAF